MTDLQLACHTHPTALYSEPFLSGYGQTAVLAWQYRRVIKYLAVAQFDVWNNLTDLPAAVVRFLIEHTECNVTAVYSLDTDRVYASMPDEPVYEIVTVAPGRK